MARTALTVGMMQRLLVDTLWESPGVVRRNQFWPSWSMATGNCGQGATTIRG